MSDFEEKLNMILSSPEAMAQVAAIARSLGMDGSGGAPPPSPPPSPPPPPPDESPPPFAGLNGLLGGLDVNMLLRLLPLLQELNGGSTSGQSQLLQALCPYLQSERREKLTRALRLAHLLSVGKKFLGTTGDDHV